MEKKVYTITGDSQRTINLDDDIFGLPVNDDVIYYAVLNENANMRVGTACTKTRAEVNGSNAKPYRQKGTGNARRGDKKSPLLVGGGVIFGPRPRDYTYAMPKKAKRLAMKSILSLQAQSDRLLVVEDFTIESGKTKDFVKIIDALDKVAKASDKDSESGKDSKDAAPQAAAPQGDKADSKKKKGKQKGKGVPKMTRTVVILKDDDEKIKRAGRNVHNVSFLSFNRLRARDLYFARRLIILEGAVKNLSDFYSGKGEAAQAAQKEAQ